MIVDNPNSRYWTFIWWRDGKKHEMGLGSLNDVSLARARDKARQAREDLDYGRDPRRERDIRRGTAKTFGEVAKEALDSFAQGWRNKRAAMGEFPIRSRVSVA